MTSENINRDDKIAGISKINRIKLWLVTYLNTLFFFQIDELR